jgi:hypothetical protein
MFPLTGVLSASEIAGAYGYELQPPQPMRLLSTAAAIKRT